MRKTITLTTGNTFVYGIDSTSGLFLQFEKNDFINFSECYPFNQRLTFARIKECIKEGLITKADYNEALKQELGNFKVYFSGIGVLEEVPEDFQYPKRLEKHYYNGTGFTVKTIGDYMKLLNLFNHPITYTKVDWYENHPKISYKHFEIHNDLAF